MTHTDRTGRQGISAVSDLVERRFNWIVREQSVSDYGIDLHVETTDAEGQGTGRLLALQVKSGTSYFKRLRVGLRYVVGPRHATYWLTNSLPVCLVIINPDSDEAYWAHVTEDALSAPTQRGTRNLLLPYGNTLATAKAAWAVIADRGPAVAGDTTDTVPDFEHDLDSTEPPGMPGPQREARSGRRRPPSVPQPCRAGTEPSRAAQARPAGEASGRHARPDRRPAEAGSAASLRWRVDVSGLGVSWLQDNRIDHPGYAGRQQSSEPPHLRVAVAVSCAPLKDDQPTTSRLRAELVDFLSSGAVDALVRSLTCPPAASRWRPWNGHGRANVAAVLATDDESQPPVAWARLIFPVAPGPSAYSSAGHDTRQAALVLIVEPRTASGALPERAALSAWPGVFESVLNVAPALARHLTTRFEAVATVDDTTRAAVFMVRPTDLVDTSMLSTVPGVAPLPWFTGYAAVQATSDAVGRTDSYTTAGTGAVSLLEALGNHTGTLTPDALLDSSAAAVATRWTVQLADDCLRLDGYEPLLADEARVRAAHARKRYMAQPAHRADDVG